MRTAPCGVRRTTQQGAPNDKYFNALWKKVFLSEEIEDRKRALRGGTALTMRDNNEARSQQIRQAYGQSRGSQPLPLYATVVAACNTQSLP